MPIFAFKPPSARPMGRPAGDDNTIDPDAEEPGYFSKNTERSTLDKNEAPRPGQQQGDING